MFLASTKVKNRKGDPHSLETAETQACSLTENTTTQILARQAWLADFLGAMV